MTYVRPSPGTTKGDLIAHDGNQDVRLGVGSDGQILFADTGVSSGMAWKTRTITAGAGLGGGGSLANNITLAVGAGTGISVGSTDVSINTLVDLTWDGQHTFNDAFVFNETGQSIDARFEGDTDPDLLTTDGDQDLVRIGTTRLGGKLMVRATASKPGIRFHCDSADNQVLWESSSNASWAYGWQLRQDELNDGDIYWSSNNNLTLEDRIYVKRANGRVGIGTVAPGSLLDVAGTLRAEDAHFNILEQAKDFVVSSDTETYMLFVDGSENGVGMGTTFTNRGALALKGSSSKASLFVELPTGTDIICVQCGSSTDFGWKWTQENQSTGDLIWKRRVSNVDTYVQYWKRSNGYVGIRTTGAPDAPLEIETTTSEGKQAVTIDQNDADQPFVDFQGSTGANATSSLSTLTNSGATTHHIMIEINGTKAWIAASTNNPT